MEKLTTHVLESKPVIVDQSSSNLELELLKFESMDAVTRSSEARKYFVNDTKELHPNNDFARYFSDPRVISLWSLYDSMNPSFKWEMPDHESLERRRFLKHPFYAAVDRKGGVVAGLWIGEVKKKDHRSTANIHLFVAPELRGKGVGSTLLNFFEANESGRYNAISCGWAPREDCNPTSFFEKHGYEVVREPMGAGSAQKALARSYERPKELAAATLK